jgi:hypothetical protein
LYRVIVAILRKSYSLRFLLASVESRGTSFVIVQLWITCIDYLISMLSRDRPSLPKPKSDMDRYQRTEEPEASITSIMHPSPPHPPSTAATMLTRPPRSCLSIRRINRAVNISHQQKASTPPHDDHLNRTYHPSPITPQPPEDLTAMPQRMGSPIQHRGFMFPVPPGTCQRMHLITRSISAASSSSAVIRAPTLRTMP